LNQCLPTKQPAKSQNLTGPVLGLANDWPEPAPGDKKSTGCRYCPITQFLAQASTGKTKSDVRRAKSQERELRAMKMNKKEGARRKYFWEKFYLPNHFFY
jgi:hypothetical protein